MKYARARVTELGQLGLPPEFCRALGLEGGGDVVLELDGREIRVRTLDDVVARAQALTRQLVNEGGSVDDFLAERRREAERE